LKTLFKKNSIKLRWRFRNLCESISRVTAFVLKAKDYPPSYW
jgi:hypothetical protein